MRGYSPGLAALETSVLVTVVFAIGMGAVAVISYFGEVSSTNRAVDELVVADAVKPLRLRMNEGTGVYDLNATGLSAYLTATLANLEQRIGTAIPYKIELQYQVFNINPDSGAFVSFAASSGNSVSAGSFARVIAQCPEMGVMFNAESTRTVSGGASALAMRIGSGRYLPMSVVVGVRVLRDLSDTGTGVLYRIVTQEPLVAYSCKSFFLRSGVEG